jgi:hypothetical protein
MFAVANSTYKISAVGSEENMALYWHLLGRTGTNQKM